MFRKMDAAPNELIAVTNRHLCKGDFLDQIRLLAASGISKIILREKDLRPDEYERLAEQVLRICELSQTECVLHTFVDVAEHLGVKSIHLPLSAIDKLKKENMQHQQFVNECDITQPAGLARLVRFDTLGFSTHSMGQLKQVEEIEKEISRIKKRDAMLVVQQKQNDCIRQQLLNHPRRNQVAKSAPIYVTAGHIFATDCKKDLSPRGLSFLQEMVQNTNLPVYAIGGINLDNMSLVRKTGAAGACLMSWCMNAGEKELSQIQSLR